jgi:N-acetylneuraminic acid mutarotase
MQTVSATYPNNSTRLPLMAETHNFLHRRLGLSTSCPLLEMKLTLESHSAAVVNGKLYILGTLQGGDIWYATPRSWIYTPENEKWTEIAPMPTSQARGSSAIGVLGDEIFLAGGMRSLNPVDGGFHDSINTTTAYNTRTGRWRTLPDLPAPRDHVGGAIVGDTLYVVGGRDHGQVNVRNTTFALDLNNTHAQWKRKADMPTARGGLATGLIGKNIYTFGGEGNPANGSDGVFPQAEAYDTESDTWAKLPSMRVPRHGTGAASIGDAIYVPGGGDHEGDGAVDTFDKFQVR